MPLLFGRVQNENPEVLSAIAIGQAIDLPIWALGEMAIDKIIRIEASVPDIFMPIVTELVYFIGNRPARP